MPLRSTPRVEMLNVSKAFGGIQALDDVSLQVDAGRIHAVVGENGAGKSTLMKILSGAYHKDAGVIRIDGRDEKISSPAIGRRVGIGIIYQEFSLAPDVTVAENVYMNRMSERFGVVPWKQLNRNADELIRGLGFTISPRRLVRTLSVAHQQVVEIAKALSENVKVLILDEPTAVLAPHETLKLFEVLRRLAEQDVAIIYISHRLNEVFEIAKTVTVLRDGKVSGRVEVEESNIDEVISLMIGRNLEAMFPSRKATIGDEVLRVERVRAGHRVNGVSFSVHKGEVLGIAGLVGSGRTETVRAIFGADRMDHGKVYLNASEVSLGSPGDAVRAGFGFVPEDRKGEGVVLAQSVRNNISLTRLRKVSNVLGIIDKRVENSIADRFVRALRVRCDSINARVYQLSGGNQQKVAVAKWFGLGKQLMIFDEPTRGVDVGAKTEIFRLINELAESGCGVVMISSEMIELIGMCDRVLVMHDGAVQGELEGDNLTEEAIMRLAIGRPESAKA